MSEQLTVNFVAFPHVWPSRTNSKTAAYLLKVGWPKHNKIRNKWLNRTYFVPCSPEATLVALLLFPLQGQGVVLATAASQHLSVGNLSC